MSNHSEYLNKVLLSRVYDVAVETPLDEAVSLSRRLGNRVLLKRDDLQPVFSFKLRGAYNKMARLSPEELRRGVIAASAGNHAQGVALAARRLGCEAVIVMPVTTPAIKVDAVRRLGGQVVLFGESFSDAWRHTLDLIKETGYVFIPPFDDPDVIAGQGTIGMEILRQHPDPIHAIFVPIGGGGLATGVSTLAKLLNPNVTVIGVEPTGAASMKASLEAGHVLTLPRIETIADGVAVKTPGDQIFPYIQKNIDDVITIDDDELVDAFLDMMEKHKMIVENAGLLPIAALNHLDCKGKNVVPVLSGGNMDVITVASLVQHGLINRGRVFTFSVQLPDRPGELLRVASIVARENGNIIKLEHNQFVNINRQSGVELRVTLEAFGHTHKRAILDALCKEGYQARECHTNDFYH